MPITTFKRFEMKFVLTKIQFDSLIPMLSDYMNLDAYCQNGKDYHINNIHYDTSDSSLIRASLLKPYYKEKFRLRSYGDIPTLEDKVFLELKKKIAGVVNKRRAVMTLQEANDFMQSGKRPLVSNYINKQVLNEIEYFLKQNEIHPTLYISYKRIAYFAKTDKNFRITFDSDIRTRREDLSFRKGNYGSNLLEENQFLMEIKITDSVPVWLVDILTNLKIYKTNFSKYGKEYQNYCQSEKLL